MTQEEIDRLDHEPDLRQPLTGHVERYSEGMGAVWWPPIIVMVGLFVAIAVTQAWR